ncbi:MAG: hypothetical protein GWN32_06995, partial [Gemmatimonadetes bacterium]|nr:hypothetical protein [Gemmatimonadota bacterium]
MTHAEMDMVGSARLEEAFTIAFPELAVTYPEGMLLNRGHQLALRIIHDSAPERPIFFAARGGLLSDLGLERWGVRHGLTTKLELRSLERDQPDRLVQGSDRYGGVWFDLQRSLHLYED